MKSEEHFLIGTPMSIKNCESSKLSNSVALGWYMLDLVTDELISKKQSLSTTFKTKWNDHIKAKRPAKISVPEFPNACE